ncbi:hypothetical protein SASPL_156789 [Salvia splendens]|uniref:Uncharacterized protein n=1 Tax=Salvia splendens TaxID=180675 RepID=A0A8X8YVC2_SALSN|nr:hypothetical protein SASPL_156789 [Salvia splendens]
MLLIVSCLCNFEVYCYSSVLSSVALFLFSLVDAGFTQRERRRQEREAGSAGTVGSSYSEKDVNQDASFKQAYAVSLALPYELLEL